MYLRTEQQRKARLVENLVKEGQLVNTLDPQFKRDVAAYLANFADFLIDCRYRIGKHLLEMSAKERHIELAACGFCFKNGDVLNTAIEAFTNQ